jgi:hypothetical protein
MDSTLRGARTVRRNHSEPGELAMKHSKTNTSASLDALARCLNTCADLSEPMTMFLDCMDHDLFGPGEQLTQVDELLVGALADTIGRIVGQHVVVGARGLVTFWSKVEGHPFFHVRLMVGRRVGAAFFFADRGLGCVSLTDGVETKFARLRICSKAAASRN